MGRETSKKPHERAVLDFERRINRRLDDFERGMLGLVIEKAISERLKASRLWPNR